MNNIDLLYTLSDLELFNVAYSDAPATKKINRNRRKVLKKTFAQQWDYTGTKNAQNTNNY